MGNVPDDHIGFLCEFMSVLSRRAVEKVQTGDADGAAQDIETSERFLHEHILSWYARFDERARLIVKTRFYRGVLSLAGGYFDFDAQIAPELLDAVHAFPKAA